MHLDAQEAERERNPQHPFRVEGTLAPVTQPTKLTTVSTDRYYHRNYFSSKDWKLVHTLKIPPRKRRTFATSECQAQIPAGSSYITNDWFTLAELGEWLKVSRTTAYRLVSTGEIPAYRLGQAIRVRRADVERWLEENRWEFDS